MIFFFGSPPEAVWFGILTSYFPFKLYFTLELSYVILLDSVFDGIWIQSADKTCKISYNQTQPLFCNSLIDTNLALVVFNFNFNLQTLKIAKYKNYFYEIATAYAYSFGSFYIKAPNFLCVILSLLQPSPNFDYYLRTLFKPK